MFFLNAQFSIMDKKLLLIFFGLGRVRLLVGRKRDSGVAWMRENEPGPAAEHNHVGLDGELPVEVKGRVAVLLN